MNWKKFIAMLKGMGYDGDETFETVTDWLVEKGHNATAVTVGEDSFELKALYDARDEGESKSLDLTDASRTLNDEQRTTDTIKAVVAELIKATGLGKQSGDGETDHGVVVGKNRLVDHPRGGYDRVGEYLVDVQKAATNGSRTQKLDEWHKASLSTYANEAAGADGGFAVPDEMRSNIEVRVSGEDSLLKQCDKITMSRQSITLPDDEATPWGSSGIQAYWEGEAGAITQSKPTLKQKRWTARKCTALIPVTDELSEDADAMEQYVTRKAGEVLDFKIGEALVRGTGAGQPLGVLTAGSTISVAKETSQVADTFLGINAIKMMSRLYPPYRSSAFWLVNPDVDPYLFRLNATGPDDIGSETASWGTHFFMPASGVTGSVPTLLGKPVIYTQHCSALGDVGDVILGSWAMGYGAGIRGGLNTASSIHLWFDQAATAYRFIMRVDGQPYLSAAISPRAGSNTMSAFVTCAAR